MKNLAKTKNLIGTKAYPRDNSYSFQIGKQGSRPRLAGMFTFDGKHPARKVTIVSNPYKLSFVHDNKVLTEEFVTVRYGNKLYVVLNHLKDTPL